VSTNGNFIYRYQTSPTTLLPIQFITQLVATNAVGCSDTAIGVLQMNPNPKASFTLTNPNACVPFAVAIQNGSTYATQYQWYLNGVLVDTARTPAFTITQPATNYTIRLIVTNGFGCRPDTSVYTFTTRPKPKAAFNVNDTLGCDGFLNVVTRNTTTNATGYKWDWGDNSPTSAFTNPTHLYNVVGHYLITLVATDGVCNDTTSRMVAVSKKPVVNFSADNVVACDSARVQFTNLTTNADRYLWTFSNGVTTTAQNPYQVCPPSNLVYTIKLVAFNADGCSDSLIKANMIRAITLPNAGFVINPGPVISIPNYSFSFLNTTTDNIRYTYQWNLGDGATASTRDVTHQYADTGSYPVRLIVFDNNTGCPDTVIKIARIEGQPGYLYVPNAFYPNSLQNQFRWFRPLGKGLKDYKFQVFDSWGKLLFETTELDAAGSPTIGWDGTFKGKAMPQDAYAWRITATFRNGKQWAGMAYSQNETGAPGHTFGTVTLFR
jgi:gliding motility-associated-like protein